MLYRVIVEIWNLPDWMTKTDYRILSGLADAEELPIQTPMTIAKNIGITRQYASQRLTALVERDLVEKIDDGYYRITDTGRSVVTDP